jgi:hypothetical protein
MQPHPASLDQHFSPPSGQNDRLGCGLALTAFVGGGASSSSIGTSRIGMNCERYVSQMREEKSA